MNRPDRQPQPNRATGLDPVIDNPYGWRRWDTPRILVTCPHCQVRSRRTASSWAWRTDGGLDAMIRCDEGGVFSVWVAGAKPDDHQPQPLDLDAIEARANAASEGPWRAAVVAQYEDADGLQRGKGGIYPGTEPGPPPLFLTQSWLAADATFIAAARTDVPALIAEVKRLRGQVDLAFLLGAPNAAFTAHPTPQPEHDHEWAYDRSVCVICGGNHGYCECGETEPCDPPQPDPLDENDHRDRLMGADRLTRFGYRHWHIAGLRHTEPCTHPNTYALADWAEGWSRPLTFADDPQTPPQATSATETALNRAALAEVAEQAHRLSEAICDLLDGDSGTGFYVAPCDQCDQYGGKPAVRSATVIRDRVSYGGVED